MKPFDNLTAQENKTLLEFPAYVSTASSNDTFDKVRSDNYIFAKKARNYINVNKQNFRMLRVFMS